MLSLELRVAEARVPWEQSFHLLERSDPARFHTSFDAYASVVPAHYNPGPAHPGNGSACLRSYWKRGDGGPSTSWSTIRHWKTIRAATCQKTSGPGRNTRSRRQHSAASPYRASGPVRVHRRLLRHPGPYPDLGDLRLAGYARSPIAQSRQSRRPVSRPAIRGSCRTR